MNMLESLFSIPLLAPLPALLLPALFLGGLLGYARVKFSVVGDPVVEEINSLLPQTQCAQCGYPGCRPYAEAIAGGDAINKCPPGGGETIRALADLLDLEVLEPDPDYGTEDVRKTAVIRESECIGCAKCIPACPVDAILGSSQRMHTIIEAECTGCELCLEPCPVDCIDIRPLAEAPLPAAPPRDHLACIRCGACETACPVDLLPQQLYWHSLSREDDKTRKQNIMDCIECGLCNAVCPSRIPLVQHFRLGKARIRQQDADLARASHARERYDFHQIRVAREAEILDRRRREREALARARRAGSQSAPQDDPVQAALARVKARQADARETGDRG